MANNPYRSPLLVPDLPPDGKNSRLATSPIARSAFVVFGMIAVTIILVLNVTQASNCGGNSGALHVCRFYPLHLIVSTYDDDGSADAAPTPNWLTSDLDSDSLARLFHSMSAGAKYSVRNPDAPFRASPREIVIVCDTEFGNVPQPSIWNLYSKSPAHAVGYSDGSSELITPTCYREQNKTDFVRVSDWIDSRKTSSTPPMPNKRMNRSR